MGSKLGLLLSFIFVIPILILSCDILLLQIVYNDLEAAALEASFLIAKYGGISSEVEDYVYEMSGANITCSENLCSNIQVGELFVFTVEKKYDPLIISDGLIKVHITRSVVIGYYN